MTTMSKKLDPETMDEQLTRMLKEDLLVNRENDLETIFDSIAESFLDLSDEGIFAVAKEEGRDVTAASSRVRDLFSKAEKKFRQKAS